MIFTFFKMYLYIVQHQIQIYLIVEHLEML